MAQIDILKDVLDYSLRKFEHSIIGSNIYFSFNNERYAIAKLKKVEDRNEYNGISIVYVSKLFGFIDQCDIYFKDVFVDSKRASINVSQANDEFEWFKTQEPTSRDLNKLAEHVEKYIFLIDEFGSLPTDYTGVVGLATQAAYQGISGQLASKQGFALAGGKLPTVELLETPSVTEDQLDTATNTDEEATIISEPEDNLFTLPVETEDSLLSEEETLNDNNDFFTSASTEEEVLYDEVSDDELHIDGPSTEDSIDSPIIDEPSGLDAENDSSMGSKKGFLSLFRGKDKKDVSIPEDTVLETEPLNNNETEENSPDFQSKPFATWNIGAKKDSDVTAALYAIDKNTYSLVISGKGEMRNFKSLPWSKHTDRISNVEIGEGITNIGNNAFKSFGLIKSVSLPDTVVTIGVSSFEFCSRLDSIRLSNNLRVINDFAFAGAESLKQVSLPDSVKEVRDYAFDFSEDFVITYKEPQRLILGAGISYSDFTTNTTKPTTKFSVDKYMN